jgi:predicted PurR-regulated permease PerM
MAYLMTRTVRALTVVALLVGCGVLLWMVSTVLDRVHTILTVIVFSILFSYLIYPPVKWLATRMPRPVAVFVVYGALAVLATIAVAFLAPAVAQQADDLARTYPQTVKNVQTQIAHPANNPVLARFPPQVRDAIAKNAAKAGTYAGAAAGFVGAQSLAIVKGGIAFVTTLALVFGITSFLISDLERIQRAFMRMVPPPRRGAVADFVVDCDSVIGGFVRGQVLLAFGVGVASTLVLLLMGVPYALLLGVLTGLISIVPIVGAIVGAVPAFLVAIFTIGLIKSIVVLALVVGVLQVQANVLAPVVVGRSVGVTPLTVVVALLAGSEAYGILGALLAIPVAGILRVVYERLFRDPAPDAPAMLSRVRVHSADL